MGRLRTPPALRGQRIGLFGGSFDPAHEGHRHVADTARKRLGLDWVWWMATPQNPLKAQSAPIAERLDSARRMARAPRMIATAFEAEAGLRFTYQTLRALQRRWPEAHFFVIIGADSLANFRYWRRWREVMQRAPIAIIARPGTRRAVLNALPALVFAAARRPAHAARALDGAPGWVFLPARLHPASSTALRRERG